MKNLFKKQLETVKPLTQDGFEKYSTKTYFNGEEMKVGDKVLFGLLLENEIGNPFGVDSPSTRTRGGGESGFTVKLITLNEKHFDLFVCGEKRFTGTEIPAIKLK